MFYHPLLMFKSFYYMYKCTNNISRVSKLIGVLLTVMIVSNQILHHRGRWRATSTPHGIKHGSN